MKFQLQFIARICILILLSFLDIYLWQKSLYYSFIITSLLLISLVVELYYFQNKYIKVINKIVLAMLYKDYSISMESNTVFANHTLFKNIQKLYTLLQHQAKEHQLKEHVYQNILNSVDTGILILQKKEQDWSIFLANSYFCNLLAMISNSFMHNYKSCNTYSIYKFSFFNASMVFSFFILLIE